MPQLQVQCLDSMGGDIDVVNAARASFGRDSSYDEQGNLRPADASLIRFLADGLSSRELGDLLAEIVACGDPTEALALFKRIRNISTHEAPFAQVELKFRVSAPLAIARQLWKSHVGVVGGQLVVGGEPQPPRRQVVPHHLCQTGLVERDLAGGQLGDLALVDVDADDFVAELGHPGRMGRPQVAGSEYRASHDAFVCARCVGAATSAQAGNERQVTGEVFRPLSARVTSGNISAVTSVTGR